MMKRMLVKIMILALLGAGGLGCARIYHHAVYPDKPVSYTDNLDRDYVMQHHFKESKRQLYFLFYLIRLPVRANGIEVAQGKIGDGEGIVNLRIESECDLFDFFTGLLTAGLFPTWGIEVEGDVVKIPGANKS